MALSNLNKRYIRPILVITLLAVLVLAFTGCEDFGIPTSPPPETEETTEVETTPAAITTDDRAILAVHEHLLDQAESYQAKVYLADFYTTSDKWSAESELLKDGASVWYVIVDMTDIEVWEGRPYWQQASWLVFQDGKVIPANRLQANALRIEADLQELSLPPNVTQEDSNGE